jgi:hypothetical protein
MLDSLRNNKVIFKGEYNKNEKRESSHNNHNLKNKFDVRFSYIILSYRIWLKICNVNFRY